MHQSVVVWLKLVVITHFGHRQVLRLFDLYLNKCYFIFSYHHLPLILHSSRLPQLSAEPLSSLPSNMLVYPIKY